MNSTSTPTSTPDDYRIRRFQAEDAAGIVACVQKVYGDTYTIHPELYHPEQIVRLNETGELVSVIALDAAGQVVGHYALELPDHGPVAESGEAMVAPEHQHHRLLERMRVVLEEEAKRLGLRGIFGRTVTNHVFSQRAVERFGEHPCGVSLGRSPATMHNNLSETCPQRMSTVMYFKYLERQEQVTTYAPLRHYDMIRRIYRQFDVAPAFQASGELTGPGQVVLDFRPDLQRAIIRVLRVGTDTGDAIRRTRRELCASGKVHVAYLELPMSQPATPTFCEIAEEEGFFFSGVAPHFFADGDALRFQRLHVEINLSLIKVENPFARELVDYVGQERQRVATKTR